MVKAIWKNKVIAESDEFEVVEGNYYFPPYSVKNEYLRLIAIKSHGLPIRPLILVQTRWI